MRKTRCIGCPATRRDFARLRFPQSVGRRMRLAVSSKVACGRSAWQSERGIFRLEKWRLPEFGWPRIHRQAEAESKPACLHLAFRNAASEKGSAQDQAVQLPPLPAPTAATLDRFRP